MTQPTDIVERLEALEAARRDFVAKRSAMNAARPDPMHGTPAERALYDERYRADHEAERELFRLALDFATWAADNQASAIVSCLRSRAARGEGWAGGGCGMAPLIGYGDS